MDQHRNPKYWRQSALGSHIFNGWSTHHPNVSSAHSSDKPVIDFAATSSREMNHGNSYITIGKGWPG